MKRIALAVLLWVGVALAFYFIIGASMYPQWWKRFLFGGGSRHLWYWQEGISALWENLTSFSPAGAVMISLAITLIAWGTLALAKRAAGHELDVIPRPPRGLLFLASVACGAVLVTLPSVKGEYWSLEDLSRRLSESAQRVRDAPSIGVWGVDRPTSGTFLYVDRAGVLEQYSALHDSFSVASETSKTLSESKSTASATIPKVASVGREEKSGAETHVTRTPPPLTPVVAAVRLIERFRDDRGVVLLYDDPGEDYEYRLVREGLKKRGVVLTEAQESRLIRGEVAVWEEKTLKLKDRRPMFFHGDISVLPDKGSAKLVARARGPLDVRVSGRLNVADLAPHVRHCIGLGTPACDFTKVTVFGIMETVKSPSERVREIIIAPIAVW